MLSENWQTNEHLETVNITVKKLLGWNITHNGKMVCI
jgi:hypothetical protein